MGLDGFLRSPVSDCNDTYIDMGKSAQITYINYSLREKIKPDSYTTESGFGGG
jgi:hypothetical protein